MRPCLRSYWQAYCDHYSANPPLVCWYDPLHRWRVSYRLRDGIMLVQSSEDAQHWYMPVAMYPVGFVSRRRARALAKEILEEYLPDWVRRQRDAAREE